jgi:MFS transporter, ACS family, DAL5 transporter family protein
MRGNLPSICDRLSSDVGMRHRHSDKTGKKFLHIVGPEIFGILGFIIALVTESIAARYVALFLMAQSYAGIIVFFSWIR